jgi:hypothetical protein
MVVTMTLVLRGFSLPMEAVMESFIGLVSGIDVIATPGLKTRCLAIIGTPDEEIQVETRKHSLQTALETACCTKCQVEVSYEQAGPLKVLLRVRLLDR